MHARTNSHAPWITAAWSMALCLGMALTISGANCSSDNSNNNPDASCVPMTDAGVDGGGGSDSGLDPFYANAQAMLQEGRQTFRYDTFGDEAFWGDTLHLHQAIAGAANGGVGSGVTPTTALAVGLKVDSDALPDSLKSALAAGQVNLDDPATTVALLQLNAVVGVTGVFDGGTMTSMGIQCALCHSTVDDSFAKGIGKRLDGWPNRDLNVGAIVSLAPDLSAVTSLLGVDEATLKQVLAGWGPGKFDAEVFLDGKGFQADGHTSAATLIPPAFGLAGVNLHTWTGWGSVTHWNAFVANLEMHGKGTFYDPRINAGADGGTPQFPVAAQHGFANVRSDPDLITPKLANLHLYQLAIPAPTPPSGSFDATAAARGQTVFNGQGKCATCHVPPLFTEPGWNMHTPAEMGIDSFQADRSPDRAYRTSPLHGLFAHTTGGFYHDGRFATLSAVVDHYNTTFNLALTSQQQSDLVQYLNSL
jgi:cytochrome c peroxidase